MEHDVLKPMIRKELALSESQLDRLISRAPHTYKVYTIPKKTIGRRTIAQPAKETKYIQSWLIENIFNSLPVHECATAYMKGSSIKKNAQYHANQSYLVKFDFKDFFTSIKADDLGKHFSKYLDGKWSKKDIEDLIRLSCIQNKPSQKLCLSIGSPCSPILSNSVMFDFDNKVSDWCIKNKITYTRYADDLAFSTNTKGISDQIESMVIDAIKEVEYLKLSLNTKKTAHLSKKSQRRVTGLIISNDKKVSIGRDRKRMISALIHRYTLNILSEPEILNLQGLLGFSKDIEPLFIIRMRRKYSSELISDILKKRKVEKN
jgi:retron-type reverse transcriptase